ncbi:hypothetical protein CSUI_003609 [Cystoisospora suis]|uniref:Uncharacterized protein n=1 Tax=Cystoisospora suis TaxID=483139 RepID=A0A2C6KEV1_9APIC|nr:hypothetical protein CSUI_003609 [Cystoisospora suis]
MLRGDAPMLLQPEGFASWCKNPSQHWSGLPCPMMETSCPAMFTRTLPRRAHCQRSSKHDEESTARGLTLVYRPLRCVYLAVLVFSLYKVSSSGEATNPTETHREPGNGTFHRPPHSLGVRSNPGVEVVVTSPDRGAGFSYDRRVGVLPLHDGQDDQYPFGSIESFPTGHYGKYPCRRTSSPTSAIPSTPDPRAETGHSYYSRVVAGRRPGSHALKLKQKDVDRSPNEGDRVTVAGTERSLVSPVPPTSRTGFRYASDVGLDMNDVKGDNEHGGQEGGGRKLRGLKRLFKKTREVLREIAGRRKGRPLGQEEGSDGGVPVNATEDAQGEDLEEGEEGKQQQGAFGQTSRRETVLATPEHSRLSGKPTRPRNMAHVAGSNLSEERWVTGERPSRINNGLAFRRNAQRKNGHLLTEGRVVAYAIMFAFCMLLLKKTIRATTLWRASNAIRRVSHRPLRSTSRI